jgi:threonylcarbamoyladenosine tRNA methylthiotransferase MtaB
MCDTTQRATVSFATLGCKTNQFETASMQERMKDAGYQVLPFELGAELVVVNTCTVTAATDAQSRNLVRRARRLNPDCRVVVTGCYAQVDPQVFADLPGVTLVIGNEEKKQLFELLEKTADRPQVAVADIRKVATVCLAPLTSFSGRSRAFVQIQNGCDAFCSYCIIPYARGASRSAVPDEVVGQVRALVAAGYAEVVLTGIHIGDYGHDLVPSTCLLELIGRIEQETGLQRLRLGSLEPTEIPDALIDAMTGPSILCPHFHIPLQSGDDNVLQRMGRHYDRAFFRDLILRIHHQNPDAAIGLDVITGFPAETEDEFSNTLSLIVDLPVSHLHVFPFSKRPGTPAAAMPDQVPGDVSKARAARLRELGDTKLQAFAARFVGRTLEVVVEAGARDQRLKGLSRNYLDVLFAGSAGLSGQLVMTDITGVKGSQLVGSRR